MRRLISLLFMVAVAAMSHAAWVADTDSSSNVMTVKVMPAKDLKKVPVSVSLANSLPMEHQVVPGDYDGPHREPA